MICENNTKMAPNRKRRIASYIRHIPSRMWNTWSCIISKSRNVKSSTDSSCAKQQLESAVAAHTAPPLSSHICLSGKCEGSKTARGGPP